MILSSSDNYSKIPEMYRPTLAQVNTPHSATVEFCPLPPLRDALCRQYRDFLPILSNNISCNWPYTLETCIERNDGTGHIMLCVERFGDEFELVVADDGIGMTNKDSAKPPEKRGSDYVAIFVRQLRGTMVPWKQEPVGTTVRIRLPLLLVPPTGTERAAA